MLKSKRALEGYVMIDHRNSPGIPGGVPAGVTFEAPTLQCCHCGTIVIVNPNRTRQRHYCANCDEYVCDNANCILVCTPFKKHLDDIQEDLIKNEQSQKSTIWLPPSGE